MSPLPGVRGHLVAGALLTSRVAHYGETDGQQIDRLQRDLDAWHRHTRQMGPATSLRAMVDDCASAFFAVLGFDPLEEIAIERSAAAATLTASSSRVGLVVATWGARLEPLWRLAIVEARKRGAGWAFVFNGVDLRIVEAGALHSRRYLDFTLESAVDEREAAAALYVICRPFAFACQPETTRSWIYGLVRESERYASAVCGSLRDGVLSASSAIVNALAGATSAEIQHTFEQSLTVVYRMLFMLFAEARGLVPLWHPVYRESYSIESLRETAEGRSRVPGLWEALRASHRLAHTGCVAGDLRVTAFNGRLFAPSGTPLIERSGLDEQAVQSAVLALATRRSADGAGRERIAYHELGVEQLGAVYESLLEYRPAVEEGATTGTRTRSRRVRRVTLVPGSSQRKRTGTFYTPQPLAQYLVRQTLGPLVRDCAPESILGLRVLDPAMGSGAFLVAACEYLARAYESALVDSGRCHSTDIGPGDQQLFRRTVAERCLFGVDLNPMATQLARLSLWLATMAADKPLSFLDHHLATGDSLLGTWLSCLRCPPPVNRRRSEGSLPLFDDAGVGGAVRQTLPARFTLADLPSDTPAQVREKERTLAALNNPDAALSRWRRVADLWCASWFAEDLSASTFRALSDAVLKGRGALPDRTVRPLLVRSADVAGQRRFFHWELEFPEAFFNADGTRAPAPGFDAVLGNPPWDMIRADTGDAGDRAATRADDARVLRFVRDAGVYEASSTGQANRYQLFVERAIALTKPGGRIGLVLPSGAVSDHGSAALRRQLFSRCDVEGLIGFDNRRGVFPIHRSLRFLLVSASNGRPTTGITCRLGETAIEGLNDIEAEAHELTERHVRLTPAVLERLSGPGLAVPDLRSPIDLTIAERAAALFPPLGDARGWGAEFGRELNATDDRHHFRPAGTRGLPVVEGKQLAPFAVDLSRTRWRIGASDARALLGNRSGRSRLAYRDVASATNRLTLIAAILPPRCVSTHTVFCLRTPASTLVQHYLCGMFNSFVLNYLVRTRVTTHVTTAVVERLPIPTRAQAGSSFHVVAATARRLGSSADDDLLTELNVAVAHLYQLTDRELGHVLQSFPLVDAELRSRTLRAFIEGPP